MNSSDSQQETQDNLISLMGVELGRLFYAMQKELVWLHVIWQEYRVLYGTSPAQLQIANRAAGFFFRIVQDELWDSVVLRIARLTDSQKSMGKPNLTIRAFPDLLSDQNLKQELDDLISISLKKAEFAREHRHKRLAHNDLAQAIESSTPLNGISRRNVEEMLESLRNVMNRLDAHYRNTTFMYQHFVADTGAERLLRVLDRLENDPGAR